MTYLWAQCHSVREWMQKSIDLENYIFEPIQNNCMKVGMLQNINFLLIYKVIYKNNWIALSLIIVWIIGSHAYILKINP